MDPEKWAHVRRLIDEKLEEFFRPVVTVHVLPGGMLPAVQSAGAVGYDASIRAIVDPAHKPEAGQPCQTLFDFQSRPVNLDLNQHVLATDAGLVYRIEPGQSVLVGLGFFASMPVGGFLWGGAAERPGFASRGDHFQCSRHS